MRYYEDPVTGSIFSLAELERMLRGSDARLDVVLNCMQPVPYSTCCLLEAAESIAAEHDRSRWQKWFSGWA